MNILTHSKSHSLAESFHFRQKKWKYSDVIFANWLTEIKTAASGMRNGTQTGKNRENPYSSVNFKSKHCY